MHTWPPLETVARLADEALNLAVAPALDALHRETENRALTNPEYARLTAQHAKHAAVEWADLKTEWDLRDQYTLTPWWLPAATALASQPVTRGLHGAIHAAQRMIRGWDDTATWSLDHHLAITLGQQLAHLADTTHGWPQSDEYPDFTDWQAALRENAAFLNTYATDKWASPTGVTTFEEDIAADTLRTENAQQALRWVATNFPSLWD